MINHANAGWQTATERRLAGAGGLEAMAAHQARMTALNLMYPALRPVAFEDPLRRTLADTR